MSRNLQLPSLTFPSPPDVFHFPEGATRDQLLRVLRRVYDSATNDESFNSSDDINIIHIRTHELEWELKNAIRRITSEEEWKDVVGDDWPGEGRGDTYVVSKRDVHFQDSRSLGHEGEGGGRCGHCGYEITGEASASENDPAQHVSKDESRRKYDLKVEDERREGEDQRDVPQLRGGAFSTFSGLPSGLPFDESCGDCSRYRFDEYGEGNPFRPLQEDYALEQEQAWIDRAWILQLQNASHTRMIDHLQQIIEDVEATVEWQDEELACAHRRISDLERKVRKRKEETFAAGRRTDFARAETRVLQKQLQQIHDQVTQFCAELDESERRILEHYPGLFACESPQAAEMRGGEESPHELCGSSSEHALADAQKEAHTPKVEAVEASSFYWFPSVSMVVLLTNPLHHFQFPKHTSLARVHQMLQTLHTEGRETDPHLRQVREILDTRGEAHIILPDTTNGRQVLISAPDIRDDASVASGKAGYKHWNRTFGPVEYQYEHMLKDSIESLKPPTTDDQALLSPKVCVYEEIFNAGVLVNKVSPSGSPDEDEYYNAGDLVDTIEHEAELSRVRSAQKLAELCKEVPTSKKRADSLGEKRGYALSLPLPPTKLGPMFPTGSDFASKEHLDPRPVGTTGVRAWRLDQTSSKEAEHGRNGEDECSANVNYAKGCDNSIGLRRNPLSLERLFTNPDTDTQSTATRENRAFGSRSPAEEGWCMWRHHKNSGCESWIPSSNLDPNRERCAFCNLPFAKVSWEKWEFDDEEMC
ncbi:uncharacterized protein N0V89_004869 [Didymosphaeria variabile]|uniref:Uncharacterized protein n=1 Tax=Didymosphaeria variabile TaxID=1932322 RepID=A0A9W9CDT7_9PLEO|nr:uncharacterized protein N0V89_004869 [Didymosphaeria variabile]KAJ4356832.1 hypothetical protein N0V89_004869 [Didymosphaeria variabile]